MKSMVPERGRQTSKTAATVVTVLAGLAGMSVYPHSLINGLLAGLLGLLVMEVLALRRRVVLLEQERSTAPGLAPVVTEAEEGAAAVPPDPSPAAAAVPAESPVMAPLPQDRRLQGVRTAWNRLFGWLTGGNPVLKLGIVVLFFGVAFLLKYAAQRNLVPIELRLVLVAFGGVVLVAFGWLLRRRTGGYGLALEGGGIGILYLVVFAAAKLYGLLPWGMALGLMVALVALSGALAILQEARGLAVAGAVGGFLAPVLLSTGDGSHVALFTYYALLNGGILGIAWFRAWRELNLLGFLFTFAIGSFWGYSAYRPEHFATTEPFLLLFFLFYIAISVLFALRQPPQLRGFIDGPLVFGLPVIVAGLQAYLVRDLAYGMAYSALGFGLVYCGLALLLWRRLADRMRLLVEAFLALGVVFGSLAIPLGLDPRWTAAAWAVEGAAMLWVGVRQQRILARLFALLLQLGAAGVFLVEVSPVTEGVLFGNRFFLGCGLIALAALFSAAQLDRHGQGLDRRERLLPPVLFSWGLLWWYGGGVLDLEQRLPGPDLPLAILLFALCTTLAAALAARRLPWPRSSLALLPLLPAMALVVPATFLLRGSGSFLAGGGVIVWPLAFILQYGLLFLFAERLPAPILPRWHAYTLWLLIVILTSEIAWRADMQPGLANAWPVACCGLVPAALLLLLERQGWRLSWPVVRYADAYHGSGTGVPLLALLFWCLTTFLLAGDPAPLPYLPLLNPLELGEMAVVALAAVRSLRPDEPGAHRRSGLLAAGPPRWLAAGLLFLLLNVMVARSVHFFAQVRYDADALFASPVLQAALAALWGTLAMVLTVGGARKAMRPLWFAGGLLLAMVVLKLFVLDLSGSGTVARIVSFLVVGGLMLIIGYFAPLPPRKEESS